MTKYDKKCAKIAAAAARAIDAINAIPHETSDRVPA